jgi:BNR/Asp-box repeat protein
VLRGKANCAVAVSVDQGKTWQECGKLSDGMDLTDGVKGRRQYFLRLGTGAKALAKSGLTITTVCQANPAIMPRLKDGGSEVRFRASGRAVVSAGPNLAQVAAHLVEGKFGTPRVTLELTTPRGERILEVHAAAHVRSGSPPRPEVKYQIELSTDGGKSWQPVVKDWTVPRLGEEPKDFWSQSFCWGSKVIEGKAVSRVRVRFRNSGGKAYARCEAHLVYQSAGKDATRVTFAWTDDRGERRDSRTIAAAGEEEAAWALPTGKGVQTRWVEFEPVPRR